MRCNSVRLMISTRHDGLLRSVLTQVSRVLCVVWLSGCTVGAAPIADATIGDAVVPPDLDILPVDGATLARLGAPCGSTRQCADEAVCIEIPRGPAGVVRLCALAGCTQEDPSTSTEEDSCPNGSACAAIAATADDGRPAPGNYCVPTCVPSPSTNVCAAINPGLACDPRSVLFTGYTEVCLVGACTRDDQCGTGNPFQPDARCHTGSGVCLVIGTTGAEVGAPCQTSTQCGGRQMCLSTTPTGTLVPGGYCTVLGCAYGGPWACPEGSKCFHIDSPTSPSYCLALGCDLSASASTDGCRDQAGADYACFQIGADAVCWLTPQ